MSLLTTAQAADVLPVSPRTLAFWRHIGEGPVFVTLGRNTVRYEPGMLERYIESRKRETTSQTTGK